MFNLLSIRRYSLGPIAEHLVTKAARQSGTVSELYKKLAEQIPQQREREAFLKSCGVEVGSTASVSRSVTAPAPGWDGAMLKAAKQQLAAYIGPIAGIVVERAAKGRIIHRSYMKRWQRKFRPKAIGKSS